MHFGFNDLGGDLTPLLQGYRPAAWVTFDGGRARWLKDTFPDAHVIYRHMPDGDNLFLQAPDARAWYAGARRACGHDNRIIIQAGNEPDGDMSELASWTCAVLDAAEADGGTVGVLAFGTCHPATTDWRGPLLPVLRKLAGSRHYLLLHEYFLFHGEAADCIGGFRNAYAACDAAGIARPQVIVGEYGFDLPGWKASQRERGLRDEDYAAKLVRGWNEVYAPAGVKAACVYAWGKGDIWRDFDVSDAGAFLTALKASKLAEPAAIPPVEPQPEPTPAPEPTPEPEPSPVPDGGLERRLRNLEATVTRLLQSDAERRAMLRAVFMQMLDALE